MNDIKKLKQQYNKSIIAHEWQQAIQILNTIISDTPKNAKFLLRRAMVFYRLKMWEETLADVVKSLEIDRSLIQAQKIKDIVSAKLNKDSALRDNLSNDNDITIDELLDPSSEPSSATGETTHQQIDRYIVLEELGRGGMGKVYKVFDPKLDRTVALKVLLEGSSATPERVQRFLREAKATAKLHHQNIVALHDIGQHGGFVFFTMDYIEGETLKNYILRVSPSLKEIVAIAIKVANAIDYAHNQGIVHRDLKPTNIMINKNGEAKIMDFGLAKILHSDDDLSRTGDSMGTPAYMSPEQADGRKVDVRTDVYALGAILYQALTSRPPFQGDHYYNIIFQVLNTDPILPRKLNPSIPVELEAICLKCLEKRVDKRYSNATFLVEDLQNFSNNRPITAKPATVLTLTTKFIRRHRTWAIASFLVILCLIGGAISTFAQWQKTIEQKNIVEEDRKKTTFRLAKITLSKAKESFFQKSEEDKRWNKCGVLATTAIEMIKNYDGKEKERLVKEAQSLVSTALKRNALVWETNSFGVAPVREDYTSSKPERFEKANLQVAFAGSYIISGSWDGKISFYDRISGKKIKQIVAHHREIKHMICHSHKKLFAFASDDDQISLWDYHLSSDQTILEDQQSDLDSLVNDTQENLETKSITSFIHNGYVSSLAISPQNTFLGSGGKDGICKIWSLTSHSLVADLKHGTEEITSLTFSKDEKFCITASKNEIKVWNIENKQLVGLLAADTDPISNLIFSPTQSVLISTSINKLKTWSFPDFKLINSLEIEEGIAKACFNHKGTLIAYTNQHGNIVILNSQNQNIEHTFSSHTATVTSINFSADDSYLVSASMDNSIKMWNVETGNQIYGDNGHSNAIEDVAFHPNGKIIASASYDGTVRLWDAFDGKEILRLNQNNEVITSCNFSHQGNLLVTGSQNGTITIWDWRNRKIIQQIKAHQNVISRVVFNPNDSLLASCSVDMTTCIWDAGTGKKNQEIKLHKKYVWDVSFHPTENWIASVSEDEFIYIWNLDEKKIIKQTQHNLGGFVAVSFSLDGKKLAYGGEDKNIHIWDYKNDSSISLAGHLGPINGIAFDASGNFIASCSDDQTIKIWNIKNQVIIKEFSNFHWLNDIAFSPNEPIIVGGSQDGVVRLWYVEHMQKQLQELNPNCFALCSTLDGKRLAYIENMASVATYSYETGNIQNIYKSSTAIFCLDISNDGKWIALGGENGNIKIIDIATKKILHTLKGHTAHLWCVHFNPQKTMLVSSSKDRTIRLWNTANGEEIKVISGHALSVYKVTFSPDGKTIASASEDRTIKIWDAFTGEKLQTIDEKEHVTLNVKFSPDSKKLGYTASQNGYIWDMQKKQKTYLYGHTGFLTSIDFSPDSKLVATGSYDKTIRLWSAETGVEEDKLIGHSQTIFSALFHPVNPILISTAEDATMRFWDLRTPYYNMPRTVPLWLDEIVSHTYVPNSSQNIYRNISTDIIETYLQSNPSDLGQLLFQFEVKETLDLKITPRPNYLWNNQSNLSANTLQSYLENAKIWRSQENNALSYLHTVLDNNPQIVQHIQESFPKLAPKLAQRLIVIAQQQGNVQEAQKKYQQALILDPQNQEAVFFLKALNKD